MTSPSYDPKVFWDKRHRDQSNNELSDDWLRRYNIAFKLAVVRWALSRLKLDLSGSCALDIGCGTGDITGLLLERGCAVTAIDISPVAIEKARERFKNKKEKAKFLVARVEDLSFPPGSFDLVTSVAVLQHIINDAAFAEAITKLADMIRAGGYLLVVERAPRHVHPTPDLSHVADRTRQQWLQVLGQRNLQLVYERGYPLQAFAPMSLVSRTSVFVVKLFKLGHLRRDKENPLQDNIKAGRPGRLAQFVYGVGERAALAAAYILDHWFFFTVRRYSLRRTMVFRKAGNITSKRANL